MTKESITAITRQLQTITDTKDPRIFLWRQDTRKGVQNALQKWERRLQKKDTLIQKYAELSKLEKEVKSQGFQLIAGVDEVGRGPLAGPVVAAAVILGDEVILGLNDSKQISQKKREELFAEIQQKALAIGIGSVSPAEIDTLNVYQATKKAMTLAIQNLTLTPDFLLIDAMTLELDYPQKSLIKGDARSNSIAAASIVAKVTRDHLMTEYAEKYPDYGFEKNAGYGTKVHLTALKEKGVLPIHRKTFAPVKDYLK